MSRLRDLLEIYIAPIVMLAFLAWALFSLTAGCVATPNNQQSAAPQVEPVQEFTAEQIDQLTNIVETTTQNTRNDPALYRDLCWLAGAMVFLLIAQSVVNRLIVRQENKKQTHAICNGGP